MNEQVQEQGQAHLNPTAQEFIPSSSNIPNHHFYYPYQPQQQQQQQVFIQQPSPTISTSRSVLLTQLSPTISETTIRRDLELFGDVRAVEMGKRRQGIVTVHFYDLREAEAAVVAIQGQHMQQQIRVGQHYDLVCRGFLPPNPVNVVVNNGVGLVEGRVVWAQFVGLGGGINNGGVMPEGCNQGTLVVFNLDDRVDDLNLLHIFQQFGPVKELRETPKKRTQRFVEFYDVRHAATAMAEMNGKEVFGRPIVVDFSRPGGHQSRKFQRSPQTGNSSSDGRNFGPPQTRGSRNFAPQTRNLRNETPRVEQRNVSRWGPSLGRGSVGSRSSSSAGSSSVHGSLSKLRVSEYEECSSKKGVVITTKKPSEGGDVRTMKSGSGRLFRGSRNGNEFDPRFLINEGAIMESDNMDTRTTVMIKNIPNKYSQKLMLNMLDNHCIHSNEQIVEEGNDQPMSAYDFVYLPIDFINKCNVGYGFVNMTSPEATLRLYKAFHHQSWEVFNSRKICEVTYARLQGLDALREHFKSSKFPGEAEEYMPVVFSPPRDGENIPDPIPIVGRASPTTLSLSPQSSATSSKDTRSESPMGRVSCHAFTTEYEGEEGCGSGGGNDEDGICE